MSDKPDELYYSYEQISDMLSHGFNLKPIFESVVSQGTTVVLVANPVNSDPILMDVYKTVKELEEADKRRESMKDQFRDKYGLNFD